MSFLKASATDKYSETIEIDGEKVRVASIGIGELIKLSKEHSDPVALTVQTICVCCSKKDGSKPTPDEVYNWPSPIYKLFSEAVNRVNGGDAGN
jgi:hypothetical protein